MLSFLLTLKRLFSGLWKALKRKNFQVLFLLVLMTLLSGTIFYVKQEGLSVLDAIYFCVATLSTLGHPTFVPQTALGKIFTIVYIIAGTGLFLGMMGYIAYELIKQTDKDNN
ncbi:MULTISPECIES: potassium channel family protein [Paenibacillus]|uniref:Transporter n=1 Tax=Paenibacillus odorifer TaxID=189426 RepID=A0A1R0WX33_9BACL|nr:MULTISPECIES: potassium channel family protein [Paenibacillus]AIQ73367.1 transporter [Paenibacillus odorifer]ETT55786.1 Ion transport 2 domain-containing protein [Paenibacillus sp. FSL H8-237]OMD11283.1 transporter [Paenibacillus odorifer]OMD23318.1 transporter [Paenibacillus odorifer]OME28096.1 transporter [Paenibacillus odorifer]